jgi:predicted transcriptional regulator YdeE
MDMEIVKKQAFYAIGKKVSCHWEQLPVEMPKAWSEVLSRKEEILNRVSPYFLDICLELEKDNFTQLVAVEVSELTHIPDGFIGVQIPEQTYIYTKHIGLEMEIANTFGAMINWAKENHLSIDPKDFKIQYTHENENQGFDLYFKIV